MEAMEKTLIQREIVADMGKETPMEGACTAR
jgi:hypothetical protein